MLYNKNSKLMKN